MDKNYYFVNEPGAGESGPYEPREILRAIAVGQISRDATVCRMGDSAWLPIIEDVAFAAALAIGREALTLAALVGSLLKAEGRLTVQAQGEGLVPLLVAEHGAGGLRGYARLAEGAAAWDP